MTRKRVLIVLAIAVLGGAAAGANFWYRRDTGVEVVTETVRRRDLEAVVSASGQIQPKRQVNISANRMGKVTRLAVAEGQFVKAGQFLLEIDPRSLAGQLQRGEAGVEAARSSLQLARANVEQAEVSLALATQNLKRQQELWQDGLTSRESLDRAQNEVEARDADIKARRQEITTREQQIKQELASLATTRYDLSQVVIASPMDGLVTRRNIEEGETVVVGTMNNAGTVLLTVADMSVLEAEVEVDETDVPGLSLGQAATVSIDAIPNRTFMGRVTEVGNSPVQTTTQTTGQRQATTFKVVVTLDEQVPNVRPGFTSTAEIITAARTAAVAVPIQALTVREMLYDPAGNLVREPPPVRGRGAAQAGTARERPETPVGHTREETEGVFTIRAGRAVFTPVSTGIAGELYFEVLNGLSDGDTVITGPFASVRELADGDTVRLRDIQAGRAR